MTWECQECGAEGERDTKPARCRCGAHNWKQLASTWLDDLVKDGPMSFHRSALPKDHPDAVQNILTGWWMESDAAFRKRIGKELSKRVKALPPALLQAMGPAAALRARIQKVKDAFAEDERKRRYVIVDDIDDPKNQMTPSQRAEVLQWYEGLNREKD